MDVGCGWGFGIRELFLTIGLERNLEQGIRSSFALSVRNNQTFGEW